MVVVIGAGLFVWMSRGATPPIEEGTSPAAVQDMGTGSDTPTPASGTSGTSVDVNVGVQTGTAPLSATVTYNGSSFSPASVTIAKGGKVTFVDSAGSSMWVASAQHPSHTTYDGTARADHCVSGYTGAAPFDQCASGTSFSFTFTKAGSFGYHDHTNSSAHGTVVVQ